MMEQKQVSLCLGPSNSVRLYWAGHLISKTPISYLIFGKNMLGFELINLGRIQFLPILLTSTFNGFLNVKNPVQVSLRKLEVVWSLFLHPNVVIKR